MSTQNTTIFISYRRKESRAHARLLLSALQPHFPGRVFMDVDGLKPGQNFRVRLEQQLQGCRVMVAVIGPDWHKVTDEDGRLRLHQPRDWVRQEIATALGRPIPVIPVLIENARMPDERHLPEDLHPLLDIQALPLDLDGHFDDAIRRLKEAVQEFLDQSVPLLALAPAPSPPASLPPRHSRGSGNPRTEQRLEMMKLAPVAWGDDGAERWGRQTPWATAYGKKGSDGFATPWVDIRIGSVVQRMRWVAPGSFLMGCDLGDPDCGDNEMPQHHVTLSKGFWLADTACTHGLWKAVTGQTPSHFNGNEELPIDEVSWNDVTERFLPRLTQWLGAKIELPTEAEWEYACRAGTQTPYWFGRRISQQTANFSNPAGIVPVKDRPANSWGLYQMHGNVWEWCAGSQRSYSADAVEDPLDGKDPYLRVLRGGSVDSVAKRLRSAFRDDGPCTFSHSGHGFRFVLRDDQMDKARVFISYAHADKEWLEKIKFFLGQLEDNGQLDIWDDTRIGVGDDWRKEIEKALSSCTIAVLLLSINFARSKFIKDEEMSRIWKRHEQEGVEIYPVLVRNFPWEEDKNLAKIQIKMHDGKALNKLSDDECDDALTAIGREISKKLRAKEKWT